MPLRVSSFQNNRRACATGSTITSPAFANRVSPADIISRVSLGIGLKGTEGIVLAADSRVTLFGQVPAALPGQQMLMPASFDNATKILKTSQKFVAAVTFGAGAIGQTEPRTPNSFMPEFEATINNVGRLSVEDFAKRLGEFFLAQWRASGMPATPPQGENMVFLVGGYDENKPYGDLYGVYVPSNPTPTRVIPDGQFGALWGGQTEMTNRLIQGFDPSLPEIVQDIQGMPVNQRDPALGEKLQAKLGTAIPRQVLSLQDCVDLSIFLVRTTMTIQKWLVGLRGVGGAVDVLTITRTGGIQDVQMKHLSGEALR